MESKRKLGEENKDINRIFLSSHIKTYIFYYDGHKYCRTIYYDKEGNERIGWSLDEDQVSGVEYTPKNILEVEFQRYVDLQNFLKDIQALKLKLDKFDFNLYSEKEIDKIKHELSYFEYLKGENVE